ncbi:hypothetical protein SAMN04487770_1286 [Butyrivibrio sp. ob235]|uniref:hypothetical protein n=1 Tax=Butyrivibrio sp. ob235 TaxID=1761780 RepID=UPI0008C2BA17|nr:hypothetical protein [Butyrivibrio sp. ob235]SEM18371.1 hypothetical protein SAMN04487770_1286 [Butyrivibrio sp. ob235]
MVSLFDAYEIIKHGSELWPLISIYEYPDSYMAFGVCDDDRVVVIGKKMGDMELISMPSSSEWVCGDQKEVYLKELFDELIGFYENNKDEKLLARLYQIAYNERFYSESTPRDLSMFRSKEDYDSIISRWREIEKLLYSEIREIMDNDKTIVYPPCVLDKWDDPFYRIKPFMLRNGYTDARSTKTWGKTKD